MTNPYMPVRAQILAVIQETVGALNIKTFRLKPEGRGALPFLPGQFLEISLPGVGEAPIGFASSPLETETIELCIKKIGRVTSALHDLGPGDAVWLRGPFGNAFPTEELTGRDLLFTAGGLGLAPLRPLILWALAPGNRGRFGQIRMLLAARNRDDFVFWRDIEAWSARADVQVSLTIDRPQEGWTGQVGFPHELLGGLDVDPARTSAVLCGPPIMIKAAARALLEKGLEENRILTTLENRMACGVGKCGKCNVGRRYVCVDGPVFRMSELSRLPGEY